MRIPSRIARATGAGALVLAGSAAGIAQAQTPEDQGNGTTTSEQRDRHRERVDDQQRPGGRGQHPRPERVDDETLAHLTAAVTEEYPSATVQHAGEIPEGGYVALIERQSGAMLGVQLDDGFAITDTRKGPPERRDHGGDRQRPERVDDAAFASIAQAVQRDYPSADVKHAGALADGGYIAHVETSDGERLGVKLNDNFTITEALQGPGGRGPRVPLGAPRGESDRPQQVDGSSARHHGA